MATGWYVLHVYSGFENKIDKTIRVMINNGDFDKEVVRDVKVPVESTVENKDGKKRTHKRNILPGYLLIELDLSDNNWTAVCQKIRGIQGVTGFVGTPPNRKPVALPAEEVRALLQKSGDIKGERTTVHIRQAFTEGEQVKIIEGPFESFTGVIEKVDADRNKLHVMVGIFGRNTPVEVDVLQVEKV
jgi:transcriptional antiterminator NusG